MATQEAKAGEKGRGERSSVSAYDIVDQAGPRETPFRTEKREIFENRRAKSLVVEI